MSTGPSRPQVEAELKLGVSSEGAEAVLKSLTALVDSRGKLETRRLESVYYDTGDLRLQRRGLTLRVRRADGDLRQTLKAAADGDAVLMRRNEWESSLTQPKPDLSLIDDPEAKALCGFIVAEELAPVFSTIVTRRTVQITFQDPQSGKANIELAIDQGVVRAGQRETPISEVELELKDGPSGAAFELGRRLNAVVPLSLQSESKAARGLALLDGRVPEAVTARKIRLASDATVEDSLAEIATACFKQWTANQAAALDGRDPEGVHQMRIGLRRLRSAVPLFAHVLSDGDAAWLKNECGWLGGSLGDARDWDVFLAELLAPVRSARPDDPGLEDLGRQAELERAQAYERARDAIGSQRHTDLALRLGAWITNRAWRQKIDTDRAAMLDEPIVTLADRLLAKQFKRARKRGRRFEGLSEAERHRVRIALKRVRYSVEFFAPLYSGKRVSAFLKHLRSMQDDLGHLNDVAAAQRMLASVARSGRAGRKREALVRAAGLVVGWHARGLADLEPELVTDWHAFAGAAPFWGEG